MNKLTFLKSWVRKANAVKTCRLSSKWKTVSKEFYFKNKTGLENKPYTQIDKKKNFKASLHLQFVCIYIVIIFKCISSKFLTCNE